MSTLRSAGPTILRLLAGAGVILAALCYSMFLLGGGWCYVQALYLLLFVLGSGSLLLLGRWEGIAAGASCWLLLILQFVASTLRADLAERLAYPVLITGVAAVLAGLICVMGRWVWRLPVSRGWLVLGLCSLLAGSAFPLRSYWIARFRGPRADLRGAVLTMTDLRSADLTRADLRCADLRFACLEGADLKGVNLAGADLRNTCLDGVDLRGANLIGTKLSGALFDPETTRWPAHFDPSAHGAVKRVWL